MKRWRLRFERGVWRVYTPAGKFWDAMDPADGLDLAYERAAFLAAYSNRHPVLTSLGPHERSPR